MARYLIATALFSVLAAAPAMASFTLIAPEPTAPNETAITAIPLAPAAQPVQPLANNNLQQMQAPAPVMTMAAPQPKTTLMAPAPQMAMPAAMTAPQSFESPVRGFGKDIPLVIAAQQIAPEGRQIAFGQGVDPSMPISWNGGKSWRNVLSDALGGSGLQLAEQGNILFISRGNSTLNPTNASLLMEPKYMRAQEPQPVANNNMMQPMQQQPMMQQQPAYLPPTAPAPVMMQQQPSPNTVMLPAMEMPASNNQQAAAYPSPTNPVVLPPAGSPIMPTMAPAPRALVAGETVIPPQQPIGYQQPPAPTMQSTVVNVPLAPQPIPVMRTAPMTEVNVVSAPVATMMPITPMTHDAALSSGSWHASSSKTLKQILEDWSQRSNVTLRWDSEFDFPVQSNVNFEGDYETAVRTLLRGFSSAQPQPIARLYRPTAGAPGVLLVTTRGNDMSMGQ